MDSWWLPGFHCRLRRQTSVTSESTPPAQAQTPRPSRVSRLCLGGNPVVGSRCLQFPGIHQVLVTSAPAHHHLPLISAQPSHPTPHCQARPASAPEHSVWFILLFEETDAACSTAKAKGNKPNNNNTMLSLRDRVWVRGPPVSPRQPQHGKALLHHGRCSYLKKKKCFIRVAAQAGVHVSWRGQEEVGLRWGSGDFPSLLPEKVILRGSHVCDFESTTPCHGFIIDNVFH